MKRQLEREKTLKDGLLDDHKRTLQTLRKEMVRKGVRPYKKGMHEHICVLTHGPIIVIGHSHGSDEREHVLGETEGHREHERGP